MLDNSVHAARTYAIVSHLEQDVAIVTPRLAPRVLDLEVLVIAVIISHATTSSGVITSVPPLGDLAACDSAIIITVVVVVIIVVVIIVIVIVVLVIIIVLA